MLLNTQASISIKYLGIRPSSWGGTLLHSLGLDTNVNSKDFFDWLTSIDFS